MRSRFAPLAVAVAAGLGIHACSDSTGPSERGTAEISVQAVLPANGAAAAQAAQLHVVIRYADGSIALDTLITLTPGTNPGTFLLEVPLSALADVTGEDFTVTVEILNGAGAVVFAGGPLEVRGLTSGTASIQVPASYTGPGSNATRVEVTPAAVSVAPGATQDFTGRALNATGGVETGAPIVWQSLDPGIATVPNPLVGRAIAGTTRGTARIRAMLLNGAAADATLTVVPPATALVIDSGNNQSGGVGTQALQPLVVRVNGSDGTGVGGVPVTFAITGGGGTLSATQVSSASNGLASVNYTFGQTVGPVTITATSGTLQGSPVTFNLTTTNAGAAQMVFTTQPVGAVAGATLPAVVVEVRDGFGNRATTFSGLVTLTLQDPPPGGAGTADDIAFATLGGSVSVAAVAGVATFSNLTVSSAGVGYRLIASIAGLANTALSNAFTMLPRPASALAFTGQPATVPANAPLPTIVVEARDNVGERSSGYTGNVTLALDNPQGAVLQGTLTVAAVNGIATFTNLTVSAPVAALRLSATGTGIAGSFLSNLFAVTQPANVLLASPSSLAFNVQRTAASPAAVGVALTATGAQIGSLALGTISYGPGAAGWITASLNAAATPATLTITPSTSALPEGSFNATIPISGAGDASLFFAVSVVVTPLTATQMAVITQPGGANSGSNLSVQPVVEIRDASGTRVLSATHAVTVSIGSGPGLLSGTLTRAAVQGRATFTDLRVTGAGPHTLNFAATGLAGTSSVGFTVNPPLTTTQVVPTTTGTSGAALAAFTPVTAAGGTLPYAFALSGGTLPTGLAFNTSTGAISGTPTTALPATVFTVTVTDGAAQTSSKTFTLTVNAALTTTQAIASRAGTSGTAMTAFTPVTASGGTAPLTFALTPGGTLPAGLAFNPATGQITGTPTATLAATLFTVTVTDAAGAVSAKTFTLTINAALTTTQAVPATVGTVGALIPTFTPVTASGGTAPNSFALSGGTLPVGMAFNTTTGAVSGTPGVAQALTVYTVTVTDAAGAVSAKTFSLTVNTALTTVQAVPSTVGNSGSVLATFTPVTASGGTTPYAFALTPLASLPTGLAFNTATGAVSGTPTSSLAATVFTVTVTDAAGAVSAKTFTLTVNGPLTTAQAVPTKVGTVGAAIASFIPVTAGGGTLPYSFALTGGTLPAGLTFNTTTGAVSGTPTAPLAATVFTVTVTDGAAATSFKTFTLTVNSALTTTQAIASRSGTVNIAMAAFTPITAAGGTTPYTFALTGGTLPTGLAFNTATGEITGTPSTTLGATLFTVTVTDAAGAVSFKTFTLTINGALTTTQTVATKVGTQNAAIASFIPVTASGGTAPYAFALTPGGTLPAGMTFNAATGAVAGTPTATLAATVFTVTVTDAAGAVSFKTFTLTINAALTTTQAVAATVGTFGTAIPAFVPVTAAGGTTPYAFALSGGVLPLGMSFNTTTGTVSGTPTTTLATTVFTVTVTDAAGAQSAKTFSLTVNSALSTTQAVPATTGNAGTPLATFTPVTASGGTTPYAFALTPGGTLPAGLAFNTGTGAISGTPTAALSTTVFTVTVTDAAGAVSARTFTLTINGPFTTTQAIASRVGTVGAVMPSFIPVTAGGGTTPYAFALSGGTLPAGLSFSTTTGTISGTPTATLAATVFTVTVTDFVGAVSAKTFTLTVNSALTTTQAVASRTGTVNTALAAFTPVTAAGGTVPYAFALTPGATLPAGLAFNTATGEITGTPTTTLAATLFTVTVTDAAGATSAKTFTLTVNGALTTTQAVPTKVGTQDAAIASFTPVTASGGSTPYAFALTPGGTLPAGLTFNPATGAISGTPTAQLAATVFTVTVTDNAGAVSAKTFSLTVNAPLTTTQAVASTVGTQNTAIPSFTPVTAAGGTTPYSFAISSPLPTGMSFNTSTGAVTGTPTVAQGATVRTVTVTDAAGAQSAKTFSLTVNTALTTTQAVASIVGSSGSAIATTTPVTAAGGTTPYAFALSGGTLPTGLSFNTGNGQLSGTPTSTLSATVFTVTVTDAAGAQSAKTFTLTVNGPLTTTQAIASRTGTVGAAIASFIPVTASGGSLPYAFALTGGTLPTGMSFNTATGAVSGTPTTALAATVFTVTVTDNAAATSFKTFTLTVNTALTTTQAIASVSGTVNTAMAAFTPVTAAGGTTPYTFAITSGGALPAGLSLNAATGEITGTPTATQAATLRTITVTDAAGAVSAKTFTLTVNGALTTTQAIASRTGTINTAIPSFTPVTASGGTTPYTFALTGGTLPTGMSFNTATGEVSGTPTATLAATVFTVTVTDNAGAVSFKTFTLTVNSALVATQAVASVAGTVLTAIPAFTPVTASGGTAPYTFAITSGGALPTGLSLNAATGQITGTPTSTQTATVRTITITDAAGAQASQTFTLTVNLALTTTQAVASTTGTVGVLLATFTPVTAAGGTTPYTFALTGGTLPTGLAFNTANGQISGTPTSPLAATVFTVTVTDNAGAVSFMTFTLTVNGPLTTTQAIASRIGTVGVAIASFIPVTASGGTTPYSFALSGGTLPTGMSFNTATGAVSGTPTTSLAATVFTVTVTDNVGANSAKTFTLTVNVAVSTVQAVAATTATQGTAITPFTPVTASGGTAPLTWAITSGGALPTGLSLNTATGQISGTPTASQAATLRTMTVTDAVGSSSSKTFTLTVNATLQAIQSIASRSGTQGTLMAAFTPVTSTGGTAPLSFAISGGTLPAGLTFNTANGQISGTPTATLAATLFTVTITDAVGAVAANTFTLTVNATLTTTQAVAATVWTEDHPGLASFTPVTAAGGTAPLTFALTGGSLPTGMSFNTGTGQVTGSPTTALALTVFTVTVTDAVGASSAKTFSLTVNPALTTTQAIPSTTLEQDAAVTPFTPVTTSGGTPAVSFALSGGTLPTGLAFSTTTGQITGTPTTLLAATVFTVTVTDAIGATSAKTFTLTVIAAGLGIKVNVGATSTTSMTQSTNIVIPINIDMSNRGTDDLGSLSIKILWDPARFTFNAQAFSSFPPGAGLTIANTDNVASGELIIAATAASTAATTSFTFWNVTLTATAVGAPTNSQVSAVVTGAGTGTGGALANPITPRNLTVTINP